jgi:hypothetical protein
VALLVGGLVAVGGGVWVFTRTPAVAARAAAAKPSTSLAGSLISQIGGRALSTGLNFLENKLEDSLGSYFG